MAGTFNTLDAISNVSRVGHISNLNIPEGIRRRSFSSLQEQNLGSALCFLLIFRFGKFRHILPFLELEDNPLNWLDDVLGVEHQNFFEGRATTYMKAGLRGSVDKVKFV